MAIRVVCPGCWAQLSAPDSAAGGKVRCPRAGCEAVVPVPDRDAEVAEDEADVEVVDEEPPDEEAEEPPRPTPREVLPRPTRRRARRQPRRRGTQPAIVIGVGLAVVLLIGGIGFAVYYVVSGTRIASIFGGKVKPPAGWTQFTYAEDGFKAYFPIEPAISREVQQMGPFALPNENLTGTTYELTTGRDTNDELRVMVMVASVPPGVGPGQGVMQKSMELAVEIMKKDLHDEGEARVTGPRSVRWLGENAWEVQIDDVRPNASPRAQFFMRYLCTDTHMYAAAIGMEDRDKLARVKDGFFDNIELIK
jgi:hypothetical protein